MLCDDDVLENAELGEQTDILEGTGDALSGYHIGSEGDDLIVHTHILTGIGLFHFALRVVLNDRLAHEVYLAVGRLIDAGDAVDRGGLARAVRADKGDYLTLVDIEVQVIDGDNAAELHGYIFNMQNVFSHCPVPPFPCSF